MFYASLRPLKHIFRSPYQFYSDDLSFWAYREMWNTVPLLGRYIFNSFFMAITVTFFTLLFVIPAAYSYARFNFPFKQGSLWVLLAVNMFSGAVLLIPLFKLLRYFDLLNTYFAMIVPGIAFCIPTSIAVTAIYAFIQAYAQQFLFAITFNSIREYMPIVSGLTEFIGYQSVKWNEMMAASIVGVFPVLIVFIFLQKYIVEGLTAGAVKN